MYNYPHTLGRRFKSFEGLYGYTAEMTFFPFSEQERFAKIVARYEKLRSQMRESTRHPAKECGAGAELLFQGVLWESFG